MILGRAPLKVDGWYVTRLKGLKFKRPKVEGPRVVCPDSVRRAGLVKNFG